MNRRHFLATAAAAGGATALSRAGWAQAAAEHVVIRSREVAGPLPHIWEECVGSDRAAITLRESWREDITRAKAELGIKRVRFHGILNDELGVLTQTMQDRSGEPNFKNVAEVYDGLVARGLSPLIELSFMPSELASGKAAFGFYRGNITPPKSYEQWGSLMARFATFLVDRYGLEAVSQWPFEVWNEPNLPFFWTGSQADYFQLYKVSAAAIKGVHPSLKVGGPSTARIGWISDFLAYCAGENAPVDFVSTHVYAGDDQKTLFGENRKLSVNDVIPAAVAEARRQIEASPHAGLPLYLDEWSSDSPAMIAHVLGQVLDQAQMMSHWVLSGTYEELGPTPFVLAEGNMGFAEMVRGIPRPSYNTYRLLHALGDRRVAAEGPALASRRTDGGLAAMVWNLAEASQANGIPGSTTTRPVVGAAKRLTVALPDLRPGQRLRVRYVDQTRGSPLPAWRAMGSPRIPTMAQLDQLRRAAQIPDAQTLRLGADRTVTLDLPPEGVALIESA
jgi:xylan 1,4-beta-xylosidase